MFWREAKALRTHLPGNLEIVKERKELPLLSNS